MNFSGLFGFTACILVFAFSVLSDADSSAVFLNEHAILIVIGGTLAATFLCFPISTVFRLVSIVVMRVLGRTQPTHLKVIQEIVELAKGVQQDRNFLESNSKKIKTPFLREAVELLLEGTIDSGKVDEILELRSENQFKRYEREALIFKVIARFPPAFGLMGTTLGMITLLRGLGTPDSFKTLGPSMAVGLVATFYGIAIANLILTPIAENLGKLNQESEDIRQIVIHGVQLLNQKAHPIVVEEYLKSYLAPAARNASPRKAA